MTIGANIAAALVAAQAEMPTITKDSRNPHFNSKFASLDGIIAEIRPILARHDLALTQTGDPMDGGKLLVHSTLIHKSGESITASVPIPLAKQDPQGAGAAMTYGRRFSLSALLCIATDEDDDGNRASSAPKPQAARVTTPKPAPATPQPSAPNRFGVSDEVVKLKANSRALVLHTSDELHALIRDKANDPKYAKHIEGAKQILAARTDDARVQRMKDAEELATAGLFPENQNQHAVLD